MNLVWLDLETTGLDPQKDHILEIGMRISVDDDLAPTGFVDLVRPPKGAVLSEFILEMHTVSGLLVDSAHFGTTPADVEAHALLWLAGKQDIASSEKLTLAGSSVHFDLAFLKVHMPRLAALFSHRLFDVSAIKLFCQEMGMPELPKAQAHRAMADIEESFAHWQKCREWWFRGGSAGVTYVVVDSSGRAVLTAGAPFDGESKAHAETEARATLSPWDPTWCVVPSTQELERQLEHGYDHGDGYDDEVDQGSRDGERHHG